MKNVLTALFLPVFFALVLVMGFYFFTRLGLSLLLGKIKKTALRKQAKSIQTRDVVTN